MKTFPITLTQGDINRGVRGNPYICPIARSIRRERPHIHPEVRAITTKLYSRPCPDGLPAATLIVSRRARSLMRRFDSGKPVAPGNFRFAVLEGERPS